MLFITLPSVRTANEMCCATYGEQFKEIKTKIYYLYTLLEKAEIFPIISGLCIYFFYIYEAELASIL